jgi:hypothetical protein
MAAKNSVRTDRLLFLRLIAILGLFHFQTISEIRAGSAHVWIERQKNLSADDFLPAANANYWCHSLPEF